METTVRTQPKAVRGQPIDLPGACSESYFIGTAFGDDSGRESLTLDEFLAAFELGTTQSASNE